MGLPSRSFAADAHDCIMVWIRMDPPNTRVWRDVPRLMASSPRIIIQKPWSRRRTSARTAGGYVDDRRRRPMRHRSLFKYYADRRWAEAFLSGKLLFRSLAYFRDFEDKDIRRDQNEGTAVYRPEGGLIINNRTQQ